MKKKILIVAMLVAASQMACKKKSTETPKTEAQVVETPSGNAIDAFVKPLPPPSQPTEEPEKVIDQTALEKDGDYSCKTSKYKVGFGFDESICLDPQTDVIYPGSLVNGNAIAAGEYEPINLKRKGATLSTTLVSTDKGSSVEVDEIKLSKVRSAISELLNKDLSSPPPAVLSFEIIEVFSEQQLIAAVGAGFGNKKFNVKGSFDFSSSSKTSKFLLKFVQQYYSIDVDLPSKPSDFISPENDLADVKAELGSVAPCYVSSVKYGRMAFFYVESNENRAEVKADLHATFSGTVNKANLDASIESRKSLSQSKISGTVIGGSGNDASKAISGKTAMIEYITNGGDYSKTSPGAPIAYTLRTLHNNKVFRVVKSTEYTMRDCIKNIRGISLSKMRAWAQDAGVFGKIIVRVGYDGEGEGEAITLFQATRDQAIQVPTNGVKEGLDNNVQFSVDMAKYDKAYLKIEAVLNEQDDRPCDKLDYISKGQDINADDPFAEITGKIYLANKDKRENILRESGSGLFYFNRIKVPKDWQVHRQIETRSCNDTGGWGNPELDVMFSIVE